MSKPASATLKLEITNDDESKTVVTTAPLDASKLQPYGGSFDGNSHIEIGMKDPNHDRDDLGRRLFGDDFCVQEIPTHFFLDLQLPPLEKNGLWVYQIEEIKTKVEEVVMSVRQNGSVELQKLTRREAANLVDLYDDLHFFVLEIP